MKKIQAKNAKIVMAQVFVRGVTQDAIGVQIVMTQETANIAWEHANNR